MVYELMPEETQRRKKKTSKKAPLHLDNQIKTEISKEFIRSNLLTLQVVERGDNGLVFQFVLYVCAHKT